jgi:cysteine synthase A
MGGGLAWACAVKGYKFVAVMSAGNTPERRLMIKAFGGKVEVVPQAKGAKKGHVSREDLDLVDVRAKALVKKLKAFRADQFNNPNSVVAHECSTGPEIWEQTQGNVTHFVSYGGSCGTLIGTAKALKARNKDIQCFVAEPAKAQFFAGKKIRSTSHIIQGGGYAMMPGFYDASLVDGSIPVSDAEALKTARKMAAMEGIMGGFSSGANVAAALKIARKAKPGSLVVTICCDTGLKYLSTVLYRE